MEVRHVREFVTPELDRLKREHFPDHDPDGPPLVLHRSDFLAAKGVFHSLSDAERHESFVLDLMKLLLSIEHKVITVVIDKDAMLRKAHWRNKEPYHYCCEVLIEKYVQCLERMESRGDVFAESRKKKKNEALQTAFSEVCAAGTRYIKDPNRISARLTTQTIKFREKPDNTAGLQIADAYAKPSMDRIMYKRDRTYARSPFSVRLGKILFEEKYDRSATGYQWGYRMKYLP